MLLGRARSRSRGFGRGGSGPLPYHADAVHFDGATDVNITSLSCTNGGVACFSVWQNIDTAADFWTTWIADPNVYLSTLQSFGAPPSSLNYVSIGDSGNNGYIISPSFNAHKGSWRNILGSVRFSDGTLSVYDTDTVVGAGTLNDSPATVTLNGKQIVLGNDTFGTFLTGNLADFQLWSNVSLLDAGGNIPEATRRLFIDASGKPVNPSVAATALGQQTILLSGNASTFGINQGTGGAFTTTGTLTNASNSPSD